MNDNNNKTSTTDNQQNSESSTDSTSSSSIFAHSFSVEPSYKQQGLYQRGVQKTEKALSPQDLAELGHRVVEDTPAVIRFGSAILVDQIIKEEDNSPIKAINSLGQTISNNQKYIDAPLITQGNSETAQAESQARQKQVGSDFGKMSAATLLDTFTGDASSTFTRTAYQVYKDQSTERGEIAEAEIQSKMIEIERDLKAVDRVFVNEMQKQVDLSYGQKKPIISEYLKRGRLSSTTKRAIRRTSAARAQARQRDKTRLSNGRPSSKGNFQTKSVGKAPTSQPTYLKSSGSSSSIGRLKMPFSKFLGNNSSSSSSSSLSCCNSIKNFDERPIQRCLSFDQALQELESNQFKSQQQETGFSSLRIEEHRSYESFNPSPSVSLPASAGPVELLYCTTFIWVQGSKKVLKFEANFQFLNQLLKY